MSFRPINHQAHYLFLPSMNNWLPERHVARFVVETVEEITHPIRFGIPRAGKRV